MTDTSEKFLIDSNAIITPYQQYYPFDFAKVFWDSLEKELQSGAIVLLDLVRDEIVKGNDSLSEWAKGFDSIVLDRRQPEIIKTYSEVLEYINKSKVYSDIALKNWSGVTIADPWLIAVASVFDYTVISFEKNAGNLSTTNPSNKPKIPDICSEFGVECKDLFYMMRQLSFLFT
ncbi:MAG: DUF4411 family protein [Mobilitalea sp.]